MNTSVHAELRRKLDNLEHMPSLPVSLIPLLRYLEQPIDSLDVQRVVDMIAHDKSLCAQCLHLANSPLFARYQHVDTVRGAVMAIGLHRMREIVLSCSLLKLTPGGQIGIDPTVFWEHSFACALVARRFALRIGFTDHDKAYLAGLLHDIGVVVHLWAIPKEFAMVVELARAQHIPLEEAEINALGTSHGESGRILGEGWGFAHDLVEVIACHHSVPAASHSRALVALVALSDLLCRMGGLGYGYSEEREVDFLEQPAFSMLLQECPPLRTFDWARFSFELEGYLDDVHRLVNLLYRP